VLLISNLAFAVIQRLMTGRLPDARKSLRSFRQYCHLSDDDDSDIGR
jgi:hypothetical protein